MNTYVIETKSLTKAYGDTLALDHVNLHVKRESIYGLIGDNGAGKSTLLKLLAGHIYPTEGELQLFNQYTEKELRQQRKRIGSMIEHPGLFPNLTVSQNLEYYRILKGVPGKEKVNDIIQIINLFEKKNAKVNHLSLGQKQRLGIGIALIGEPELLMLDEPINGLDPSGIIELRNLLLRLNQDKNITIILSSHILTELEQLATTFGFLSKGKLLEEISASNLHKKSSSCIEIKLSDVETFAVLMEEYCPNDTYKVLPEHIIQIINPKSPVEKYSKLATDHGIYTLEMRRKQTSLEDYYMNLKIGGTIHA